MFVFAGRTSMLCAQEGTHEEEDHGHDNVVALFLGGVTHLGSDGDPNESGFAVGLDYARLVTSRISVGLLVEYATEDAERDFTAAVQYYGHRTESVPVVAAAVVEMRR